MEKILKTPSKEALELTSVQYYRKHTILPFLIDGDILHVYAADTLDASLIDDLKFLSQCTHVSSLHAAQDAIHDAITQFCIVDTDETEAPFLAAFPDNPQAQSEAITDLFCEMVRTELWPDIEKGLLAFHRTYLLKSNYSALEYEKLEREFVQLENDYKESWAQHTSDRPLPIYLSRHDYLEHPFHPDKFSDLSKLSKQLLQEIIVAYLKQL